MKHKTTSNRMISISNRFCLTLLLLLLTVALLATGQQQRVAEADQQQQQQQQGNFPYYMQSPIVVVPEAKVQQPARPQQPSVEQIVQRASIPRLSQARQAQPNLTGQQPAVPFVAGQQQQAQPQQQLQQQQPKQCMYDKRYFANLDECLARRPHATVGLPAFKNEDLLVKSSASAARNLNSLRGAESKRGCLFTLSNGMFKNYQIAAYSLDSDTQCLDSNGRLTMALEFSNATLYYLWQLRCLNYADQLLDDATLNGKLSDSLELELQATGNKDEPRLARLCAGSSQTFGFASLQLSNLEAQLELATDIYKNWRVTNVTLAFARQPPEAAAQQQQPPPLLSSIRDFTFESLDGDELNWRHLQTFSNWSRNRMHSNFLEQFRRFVWISLQRCLGEKSEKLPVKLFDLFADHKYS